MRNSWLPLPIPLAAAPLRAEDPLPVQILTLAAETRTLQCQLAGTIKAPQTVSASLRAGGRILSVAVNAGDRVTTGDEIARVDGAPANAARDAASARLPGPWRR